MSQRRIYFIEWKLTKPEAFPGLPQGSPGITRDAQGSLRKTHSPQDLGGVPWQPGEPEPPRNSGLIESILICLD